MNRGADINEGWRPRLGLSTGVTTICPSCLGTGLAVTHPPLFGGPGTVVHLEGSVEVAHGDPQLGALRERLLARDAELGEIIRRTYLSGRPQRPSLRWDQRRYLERELAELGVTGCPPNFDQAELETEVAGLLREAGYESTVARVMARELMEGALEQPYLAGISIWRCRCGRSSAAYTDGPAGRIDRLELQLVSHLRPDGDFRNDATLESHWRDVSDGLAALGRPAPPALIAWLQWLLDEFAETAYYRVELIDEPGSAWIRKLLVSHVRRSILKRAEGELGPGIAAAAADLSWWLQRDIRESRSHAVAALTEDPSPLARLDHWVRMGQLSAAEATFVRATVPPNPR